MLCVATSMTCVYQIAGFALISASWSGVVSMRRNAMQDVSALTTGGAVVQPLEKIVDAETRAASIDTRAFLGSIVHILQ